MNNALANQTEDAGVSLLDSIEPEIRTRLTSRRGLFAEAAAKLGAAATIPAVLAVASTEALGEGLPGSISDVLNFALTLEYLEAEFYHLALTTPGLISARHRAAFAQIGKHEIEHVRTLQGALGGAAIASPSFDYTGRGQYPDVFSNFATFAAVSNTFEDLGVAAYKGQAPFLLGTPTLTVALDELRISLSSADVSRAASISVHQLTLQDSKAGQVTAASGGKAPFRVRIGPIA